MTMLADTGRATTIVACAVCLFLVSASSSAAGSAGTTLRDQAIAAATRAAVHVQGQPQSGAAAQAPRGGPSTLKAVLVGAALGGALGAVVGGAYCSNSDCGGGPARGAKVFGLFGTAIGAGGGLAVALIARK